MKIKQGILYEDISLVPQFTSVESDDVDYSSSLNENMRFKLPLFSIVYNNHMARMMALAGGLSILPNNLSIIKQAQEYSLATQGFDDLRNKIGVSVGVEDEEYERLDELVGKYGANIVHINTLHAYDTSVMLMMNYIKEKFPQVYLIVGDVCTVDGAKYIIENGADAIKVGASKEFVDLGMGTASFSSISEIYEWCSNFPQREIKIIDSFCNRREDFMKSLCFSDFIHLKPSHFVISENEEILSLNENSLNNFLESFDNLLVVGIKSQGSNSLSEFQLREKTFIRV